MTIFRSARLKLTAWYLLIIMAVSLLFSGIVYRIMTQELRRGFGLQILRQMPHDIREEYLEKVELIRRKVPDVAITTVAFPRAGSAGCHR